MIPFKGSRPYLVLEGLAVSTFCSLTSLTGFWQHQHDLKSRNVVCTHHTTSHTNTQPISFGSLSHSRACVIDHKVHLAQRHASAASCCERRRGTFEPCPFVTAASLRAMSPGALLLSCARSCIQQMLEQAAESGLKDCFCHFLVNSHGIFQTSPGYCTS